MPSSRGMRMEKCENVQKLKFDLTIFVNFLYEFKCGIFGDVPQGTTLVQ